MDSGWAFKRWAMLSVKTKLESEQQRFTCTPNTNWGMINGFTGNQLMDIAIDGYYIQTQLSLTT